MSSMSVSEKGSNKTPISKESSFHEDEWGGLEGAGRGSACPPPTLKIKKEKI